MRKIVGIAASAALATAIVAGCSSVVPDETPPPTAPADTPHHAPATVAAPPTPERVLLRERARWVAVDWKDLPGWDAAVGADRLTEALPALRRSCERPAPSWGATCAALLLGNTHDSDASTRQWLVQHLQPYRIESVEGSADGLITGYFEPLIDATRRPLGAFRTPVHLPPTDLSTRRPYWTREQLDTLPEAKASLRGREIAYVADPMDALLLQIQGSGRLRLAEPNGRLETVRLAFAGHNDQPYKSVGRWLVERGAMTVEQANWPAIKAWAQRNPHRLNELLWSNPRVVFFREERLADPAIGPRGSQGVPLVPGRSIAVDPLAVPYGTPVWLDTTEPLAATPLRRLVVAQDTGGAIVGAVRADYFWGWGEVAEQQAGRMKQPLRMWALWPKARPD